MTVLPDVLTADLDIVFCGTAAGNVSALQRGVLCRSWQCLLVHALRRRLDPAPVTPKEYRQVVSFGLGFTDLVKSVAGVDSQLLEDHFDRQRLREVILRYEPKILAFTSKRAASEFLDRPVEYGLQPDLVGASALFVLPSPSGAARRWWDVRQWQELARLRAGGILPI